MLSFFPLRLLQRRSVETVWEQGAIVRIAPFGDAVMANATKIEAQKRTGKGTRAVNRLRLEGLVPANLYGHGQPSAMMTVANDVVRTLVYSGQLAKQAGADLDVVAAIAERNFDRAHVRKHKDSRDAVKGLESLQLSCAEPRVLVIELNNLSPDPSNEAKGLH